MIYTLTFAPAIDYYMEVPELTGGAVNRAGSVHTEVGGKGVNVSLVLRTLGITNKAVVITGGFTGIEIKRRLVAAGLDITAIDTDTDSRINVKFPFCEVNAPVLPISEKAEAELREVFEGMSGSDMLVISGGIPDNINLIDLFADVPGKLIFDVSGKNIAPALTLRPYLIKPNHQELCEYGGIPSSTDPADFTPIAKRMLEEGAENVLVSLGEQGAMLFTSDGKTFIQKAHHGTAINTVGAGDSFLAGFTGGIYSYGRTEQGIKKALNLASAAGGASAFSVGLPKREKIDELLAEK
jgi:1-phosphofructokinase